MSKKLLNKIFFVAVLKVTDENSTIRSRIRYPYQDVTDPQQHCLVIFVFLPKYPLLTAFDEKLTGPTAFSRIAEGAGSCRRFSSKNGSPFFFFFSFFLVTHKKMLVVGTYGFYS
jgi:hypothetical protein